MLSPDEVNAFTNALRRYRDRAMVSAMLLGGLRRSEALGLRRRDVNIGERRLFVVEGKGAKDRIVPISPRFFADLDAYLIEERPQDAVSDHLFLVLKGPHRGQPLTAAGLEEIVVAARRRAGIPGLTCHQLRHTCLTRLREAGMPLEAIQAQAGHRSIETTKVYVHLSNTWLAEEYMRAIAAIDEMKITVP